MVLCGTNTRQDTAQSVNRATSSITQLILFNSIKRCRPDTTPKRHNLSREIALPLYLGLLVHSKTRQRDLIDTLYHEGLSVSYKRLLEFTTELANQEIQRYEHEGVICPSNFRNGLFTTGCLDNIDHNPSSTLCNDSFHGTAISVTQHITDDNVGQEREVPTIHGDISKSKMEVLPLYFTNIHPVSEIKNVGPSCSYHNKTILNVMMGGLHI